MTAGAGQTNTPNPHNDSFRLEESTFALTDRWTEHEVAFRGANYVGGSSGVIGAFLVTLIAPDDDQPTIIHIDDIRWAP